MLDPVPEWWTLFAERGATFYPERLSLVVKILLLEKTSSEALTDLKSVHPLGCQSQTQKFWNFCPFKGIISKIIGHRGVHRFLKSLRDEGKEGCAKRNGVAKNLVQQRYTAPLPLGTPLRGELLQS